MAGHYAVDNMARQNIPLNFDFLSQTAGFEINQTLVPLLGCFELRPGIFGRPPEHVARERHRYCLCNHHWFSSLLSCAYRRIGSSPGSRRSMWNCFRNIPLLLQLVFWYNVVLKSLPAPRQSLSVFGLAFLNTRGIILPRPLFADGCRYRGSCIPGRASPGVRLSRCLRNVGRPRRASSLRSASWLSA